MLSLQMFWPTVLAHKIDADSPLWDMSARDLGSNTKQFEIVLTFEGTTPETGNTVQVKKNMLHYFLDYFDFEGNLSWLKKCIFQKILFVLMKLYHRAKFVRISLSNRYTKFSTISISGSHLLRPGRDLVGLQIRAQVRGVWQSSQQVRSVLHCHQLIHPRQNSQVREKSINNL